jgi:NTE family protein
MADPLDTLELLRRNAVFGQLNATELAAVARQMAWLALPGGHLLFQAGEASDALYLLKSGSLGAYRTPEAGGPMHLAGMVTSGDSVGALGLLTGRPQAFEIRALRDSELLRLSRAGFEALTREHPEAMLGAVRNALDRLLTEGPDAPTVVPRTFAVLPFDRHVPARDMAERLRHALLPFGPCLLVDAALGRARSTGWFAERENEVRFVLYVDEGEDPAWRELCQRQADALLLLVNAGARAQAWPDRGALDAHAAWERPRHLLLLHPGDVLPGAARRWCTALDTTLRHHHIRGDRDLARLGRLLARRSTGLVLSGGGARGFAAIGMVRALREAGTEIDAVGGTSIGAIIGAGVACEWDDRQMREACRRAFVDGKPLADRTVPLVALSRGQRTARLLHEAFGERDIEDLPLPYFCVVANLTSGNAETRRDGRLWYWLRASSAIPGILPPVFHRRQVYVDGAVINNLPTDVMRDDDIATIIAGNIRGDDALTAQVEEVALPPAWKVLLQSLRGRSRPGLLPILLRAGMVNAEAASVRRRELATRLLTPALEQIGLLEWSAYDETVEAGYRSTMEALAAPPAPAPRPADIG